MEDTNERLYVRWTPEEDTILMQLVEQHGTTKWSLLSTHIPGRSSRSCFRRWNNHLNPKVKHTKFTPLEDAVMVEEQAKHGNIWATIAERLPGRTETAIRLRWNKHLSEKRYSGEFNVDEREANRPYLDNNNDASCLATFMKHMLVNEVSSYIDKFQPGSTLRINTHPSTLLVAPSTTRIRPRDSADVDKQSTSSVESIENLVIIGSGPAGYTAAIHAAQANLKPVVFEGFRVCGVPEGQLMAATEVKNFPGFPDGITESDLLDKMKRQAECLGAELYQEDVEFVDVTNRPFVVESSEHKVKCHSLIVATGVTAKRLHLRRELEFWSRGISPCGVCDGASSIFKGQDLAVVGGGDTATGEALYLSEYARHVHLLVRRDRLRASKAMQDRVLNNPNITVHYNTETVDIVSNIKLQMAGIVVRNIYTNKRSELEAKGLFYGIGHMPNSQLFEYQINLDSSGYILVKEGAAETSVEGVFAAGDVQDHEWRQAISAAGLGCVAALSVESYLTIKNLLPEFDLHTEEVEQELNDRDVQEKFDITLTKHKGQNAYLKLYHESPRLVCVLYTSPTCGSSRALKPILSKVIDEYDQNVHFVEIDITEDPEVAEAAGIMGTPGVEFFKNRETLWIEPGVKTEDDYREFIEACK